MFETLSQLKVGSAAYLTKPDAQSNEPGETRSRENTARADTGDRGVAGIQAGLQELRVSEDVP
jgi:hypothetical protein